MRDRLNRWGSELKPLVKTGLAAAVSQNFLAGLRFESSIEIMNKVFRKPQLTPYEADYARWCAEQGALLREGRLSDLDRENLAEEIESLGRSDKREIENRLMVLLLHLLKWKYQPGEQSGSWKGSIREQRKQLSRILFESPSLRDYPRKFLMTSTRQLA